MNMTLSLNAFAQKWADVILNSEKIKEYCQNHYQKDVRLFIGGDPQEPPRLEDSPYIMILPSDKEEGMVDENEYIVYLLISINQPGKTADGTTIVNDDSSEESSDRYNGARVIVVKGQQEIIEFSELVIAELQDSLPKFPISDQELSVLPGTGFPQFVSTVKLTTQISPAMGETLTYDEE